jgi:pectinesterase
MACTPEEIEICKTFAVRCPIQPEDVMMERQPDEEIPAGPDVPSTATRPQLTEAEADALYTIGQALRAGGVYEASYTGSGTGPGTGAGGEGGATGASGAGGEGGSPGTDPLGTRTVTYDSEDDWDPRGPIEDVTKIVPGIVVDPNGDPDVDGTFRTLGPAITAAGLLAGCPRAFIKVMPGTYRAVVTVNAKTSAPPLTIYGVDRDPSKIVFVFNNSAATEGVASVQTSASFTNSLPRGFQARNLTIQNDYVAGTEDGDPEDQTAVALVNQGDQALYDNVRILGHRNALYVKSTAANEVSRSYFRNCYIEGDEDMILGRGTAVFDQSRIHSLGDRVSGGAITAPSTRVDNPYGILIINSEISADARVSDVYLGHSWNETADMASTQEAVGKTIVRNSFLGAHIRAADPWAPTSRTTPQNPTETSKVLYTSDDYYVPMTGLIPPEFYLAEFGNSGPGAAQPLTQELR